MCLTHFADSLFQPALLVFRQSLKTYFLSDSAIRGDEMKIKSPTHIILVTISNIRFKGVIKASPI